MKTNEFQLQANDSRKNPCGGRLIPPMAVKFIMNWRNPFAAGGRCSRVAALDLKIATARGKPVALGNWPTDGASSESRPTPASNAALEFHWLTEFGAKKAPDASKNGGRVVLSAVVLRSRKLNSA